MKVIQVEGEGKTARLKLDKSKIPSPKPDEVLIKNHAAGVNRADILQKQGKYPPPAGSSDIIGLETAGIIEKIGKNVTNFQVGDKVCALLEGGGYAEYSCVKASQVLPVPRGFDFVQAASIPEVYFTVWSNLFYYAKMQKGESLLVHGGTSGIGTAAIQIAKAFGIKCFVTAGSDEKCAAALELGTSGAINYKKSDFTQELEKVDVILDMVGGDYYPKNLKMLKKGGRLVCIAFLNGVKANMNFAPLVLNNLCIMGTTLRDKDAGTKAQIAQDLHKNIWPLFENGSIKPVVDSVFSIEDAEKAHDLMQSSKHIGKIVLKIC